MRGITGGGLIDQRFPSEKFVPETPFLGAIRTGEPGAAVGSHQSGQSAVLAALDRLFGAYQSVS